jgi:hypothetical protein
MPQNYFLSVKIICDLMGNFFLFFYGGQAGFSPFEERCLLIPILAALRIG